MVLNKAFSSHTLSIVFIPCFPDTALDLIFAWESFLNFSVACHPKRQRRFKTSKSWLLFKRPSFSLSLSAHILLQAARRNQATCSTTLCLEIFLAKLHTHQEYFLLSILQQAIILLNFLPLHSKDSLSSSFLPPFSSFLIIFSSLFFKPSHIKPPQSPSGFY